MENSLQNLQKLQSASTAQQVKDLYHSLKVGGHLLPVDLLPEYVKQIECKHWDLDYNGNILLNHFGGERNKLVAFESSPDGNCFYNSLSLLMFGNEKHAYKLRYLLLEFIIENFNHLRLNNPLLNIPNLNLFLGLSISNTLLACSKIPISGSKDAWSTSMTGFCASKAFNINLNIIYPPVSGFEDPYYLFPQRFEVSAPRLSLSVLWSSSSLVQTGTPQYLLNHFLPCCSSVVKRYKFPNSYLALINKIKEILFSPLSFVGFPTNFFDLNSFISPKVVNNQVIPVSNVTSGNVSPISFNEDEINIEDVDINSCKMELLPEYNDDTFVNNDEKSDPNILYLKYNSQISFKENLKISKFTPPQALKFIVSENYKIIDSFNFEKNNCCFKVDSSIIKSVVDETCKFVHKFNSKKLFYFINDKMELIKTKNNEKAQDEGKVFEIVEHILIRNAKLNS